MRPDSVDPIEAAWELSQLLEQFHGELWQAYEKPFVERCILELNAPPDDLGDWALNPEDDIPF